MFSSHIQTVQTACEGHSLTFRNYETINLSQIF